MQLPTYRCRDTETHFILPVIIGIQGGKRFYSASVPLRHVAQIIPEVNQHEAVENRSQRKLNSSRAEKIKYYVAENPENYVLPALTLSIMKTGVRQTKFEPVAENESVGELYIPKDQTILISDGQHRLRAIRELVNSGYDVQHDSISLTIYDNVDKKSADQLFVDINLNVSKPSGSINTLYNHRDVWSELATAVSKEAKILKGRTEYEAASCTGKNLNVFPLKSVMSFCKCLSQYAPQQDQLEGRVKHVVAILDGLHGVIPAWHDITQTTLAEDLQQRKEDKDGSLSSVEYHRIYGLATSALMLEALALYCREFIGQHFMRYPNETEDVRIQLACEQLQNMRWDKEDEDWQHRLFSHGRIAKNKRTITLASNRLMIHACLKLPIENETIEMQFTL